MSVCPSFYCVVSPEDLPRLRGLALLPALNAYRVNPGARLSRACGPMPVGGGLLVVALAEGGEAGPWEPLCRQCVLECRSRGAAGVLLDWDRFTAAAFRLARTLGRQLERAGLCLLVPEAYAGVTEGAGVLISTALSGGSLELRLREALERHGPERVVLALERMGEDYTLPAPAGRGQRLTPQALSQLRSRRPCIYWSQDLCARYFTYQAHEGVHFVLFDDDAALQEKLALARRLGIRRCCGAWEEVASWAGNIAANSV